MNAGTSPAAAFHLAGDRSGLNHGTDELQGFRPAAFANYHDLLQLRYDYPAVLVDQPTDGVWIRSLADITDHVLRTVAEPGASGEEARRQVLSLEQSIRTHLESSEREMLSQLWLNAQRDMAEQDDNDHLAANLQKATAALDVDGELVGCDRSLAPRLLQHGWRMVERWKADQLYSRIAKLSHQLSDILKVNYVHSSAAREAGVLESTMGSDNRNVFDFQAMAKILATAPTAAELPDDRRERISAAIRVLEGQQFVSPDGDANKETFHYQFDHCEKALQAWRMRLPSLAELIKAISIAELEIENRYDATVHDPFFNQFDEDQLGPSDLEPFPSYLLIIEQDQDQSATPVLDLLQRGLPFKILVQATDILGEDTCAQSRLSFGLRGQQLARMALGLENVFVMQAANASLLRLQESVGRGLLSDRPALFSIYAAVPEPTGPSPYLLAAAATESRAFPGFTFDPAAGDVLAEQFDLGTNPSMDYDWPSHVLSVEDQDHNHQTLASSFTLIDFIATHPGFASRFARVEQEQWTDAMVPASDFLGMSAEERNLKVPYVLLIDDENNVFRAVFDHWMVDAAERCTRAWRKLKEWGGINNSHVKRAVEILAQNAVEGTPALSADQPADATDAAPTPVSEPAPVETIQAETGATANVETDPPSGEPWIETIRCTTCNECTEINDRMFNYNEDKRAFVSDPDAGTFRELVEAAETCQVAIIHPGQPRNPDEEGLEELLLRAEPFN